MTIPKNILVVRTDRIGDVVLSLPMASVLKKNFPNAKITYLLRAYTKPLAVNNPNIDEVITLIEENNKVPIGKNILLLKNKYDVCIAAFPSFQLALILFLAGIKTRIGTGYRWYSFLFNKRIYEHRKYAEHHELEFNIRLLKQLGIDEKIDPLSADFGLIPTKKSEEFIDEELKKIGIDASKRIVIVHPGSGGSSIDLPLEKMKELIFKISQLHGVEILITGSIAEKELCGSLIVNEKTINLAGKYELPELIALINKCVLFIANSTGPIHIAAALGKFVVGFYPKIVSCSVERWGPYTNKKFVFTPTIDCKNCTREQCKKLNCMESINIDEVFSSVKNILTDKPVEKK